MDVDRVSQMNGVGREATPVWTKSSRRRRKSVPGKSTADDPEEENAGAESYPAESDLRGEPHVEDESAHDEEAEAAEGGSISLIA